MANSENFFDFSTAESQREFGGEPIPGGTIALFKMSVRRPREGMAASHPMVTQSKNSAFQYLDCELEIVAGTYKGRKIWQNMGVAGDGSDGHAKAINITRATIKAMLQASRNIMPGDNSQAAQSALVIKGFEELDGLTIPIKVGFDKVSAQYPTPRNTIRAVITPEKQEYAAVMAGGEILGSEPAPTPPAAANASPGGYGAATPPAASSTTQPWAASTGTPSAASVPPQAQGGLPGASVPSWAR